MKVQLITSDSDIFETGKKGGCVISNYYTPISPDEFDLNIIDFSSHFFLTYIDYNSDFSKKIEQIQDMIRRSIKTNILYALPYSVDVNVDFLNELMMSFLSEYPIKLVYENTRALINDEKYTAAFYSLSESEVIVHSELSDKAVMCKLKDNMFFTTLSMFDSIDHMKNIIDIILPKEVESPPEWFSEIEIMNDSALKKDLEYRRKIIEDSNIKIQKINEALDRNNRFKSVLYSTGGELVSVILDILEQIFDCNLKNFKDEHKEDFVIIKDDVTFVGEIKGISPNLKSSNVSQLVLHCDKYKEDSDFLPENEYIKGLLIVNTKRKVAPKDRIGIENEQITVAYKNEILIITTEELLKLFEASIDGKFKPERCKKEFKNRKGLFSFDDMVIETVDET